MCNLGNAHAVDKNACEMSDSAARDSQCSCLIWKSLSMWIFGVIKREAVFTVASFAAVGYIYHGVALFTPSSSISCFNSFEMHDANAASPLSYGFWRKALATTMHPCSICFRFTVGMSHFYLIEERKRERPRIYKLRVKSLRPSIKKLRMSLCEIVEFQCAPVGAWAYAL